MFERAAEIDVAKHTLRYFGDEILVQFEARKFKNARAVWINERWFLGQGVDVLNSAVRQEVELWLTDEFGYATDNIPDRQDDFDCATKIFFADRYGGGGIGANGGSGRSGCSGGFSAKGIGVTPLLGNGSDEHHSNGYLSLEDAIREAIYSEVAYHEFPFGAIPVIGIISTGTNVRWSKDSGKDTEPRAILIRPVALRVGHFDRAVFFSRTPFSKADHIADAKRVSESVRVLQASLISRSCSLVKVAHLRECFLRIAEQMGFGAAHRLYYGAYTSSNVGINGELLDFGGFRAVQNWQRIFVAPMLAPFGTEQEFLDRIISTTLFYFQKYGKCLEAEVGSQDELRKAARAKYEEVFDRECLKIFSLPGLFAFQSESVVELARAYFQKQQRIEIRVWTQGAKDAFLPWCPPPWVHLYQPCGEEKTSTKKVISDGSCAVSVINQYSDSSFGSESNASRSLVSRPRLFREVLQARLYDVIRSATHVRWRTSVAAEIDACLSESRRVWRYVPSHFSILAQSVRGATTALYCRDEITKTKVLVLDLAVMQNFATIFDKRISIPRSLRPPGDGENGRMQLFVKAPSDYNGASAQIEVFETTIVIPPMTYFYCQEVA